MRTATYVQHVASDPRTAVAFLADLRNDLRWRKEITAVEVVSGEPGTAGACYRETLIWEGMEAHATLTVSELDPSHRLVLLAEDPGYSSTYEYTVTADGNSSRIELAMTLTTDGPLRLIEPFMAALITRWLERDLPGIDAAIRGSGEGEVDGTVAY